MKKPRMKGRVWLRRAWLIVTDDGYCNDAFTTRSQARRRMQTYQADPGCGCGWETARVVEYRVVEAPAKKRKKGAAK